MKKIMLICCLFVFAHSQNIHAQECVTENESTIDLSFEGRINDIEQAPILFEEKDKIISEEIKKLAIDEGSLKLSSKDFNVYQLDAMGQVNPFKVAQYHDLRLSYTYEINDLKNVLTLAKALNEKGFNFDIMHSIDNECE